MKDFLCILDWVLIASFLFLINIIAFGFVFDYDTPLFLLKTLSLVSILMLNISLILGCLIMRDGVDE